MPSKTDTTTSSSPPPKPLADNGTSPAQHKRKVPRRDTLHVSYADGSNHDVVVFGTRTEALEHAIAQKPPWDVVALLKGQRLSDAIAEKEKS